MIIRSPEPEVKILVDRDPVKTSFEEWTRPSHFSRTIDKGPDTTTWIWNLHADAYDFDRHTSDLEIWRASGITSELQLYCTAIGALVFAALMLFAGLDPVTGGLRMTDIAHHHLAIVILFLIAGHMYKTNWGIGHGLKDFLEAHKGPFIGQGHKGLYEILTTSWHAQLSLNLDMLGSLTIVVAYYMYSMPPYPYLATDYGTQLSLFTHHMWIGGFLIVGAAAYATIFMVRDYDLTTRYNDLLDHVLRYRDEIISHLNWASHGATATGATASTSLTWEGGDLVAVGGKVAWLPIPLGTADFLVHHIHTFTIHVTVLILLKGILFARSSHLIPDKANLGFHFPFDGLGRGGTCQVSAWDHVFLGLF
ncbi:Photosystem I chlorophyll a apoprotein A1 [Capsicum annuum]|nr:Photosystem I chlorophyll a apoprotein A1 [Capsicum annuum]KAF3673778.1 Photosystem I chlorophyll a apoprotein A1 [Capsicum annuum]